MRRRIASALLLILAVLAYVVTAPRPGPRSLTHFDPDRVADLELGMWEAYYAKEKVRLFGLLVRLLREQYRYSWWTATLEGFHLARAAATFANASGNYEVVLPDLEDAYRVAKDWVHAGFDPHAVARAELAWWVARRIPGQNSPAQVGMLMADEYALLYEAPRERVAGAALLRAEAAALRDAEAAAPDWEAIRELLRRSYAQLLAELNTATARDGPPTELQLAGAAELF